MDTQLLTWIALAVLFSVAELATMAFVALYFAIGSVVAAVIAGTTNLDLPWQLAAFTASGLTLLALTRPFIKGKLEGETMPTNVHSVAGKSGIVTIPIDNNENTGQIRIGSEYWTARLDTDTTEKRLEEHAHVIVERVEGVTAWVKPSA